MGLRRYIGCVALVSCGALLEGCFWRKKPQAAQPPPAPPSTVTRKPAVRKPAPTARTRRSAPQPEPPEPPATGPQPEPVSASALGEILSPEQARDLTLQVTQSLDSARRSLAAVGARPLTREQREAMRLARSFISQAERARARDLTLAAQLAQRADLLARSLVAGSP